MIDERINKMMNDPLPLTPAQKEHLETVKWLVCPGNFRSGRTRVLAVAMYQYLTENIGCSMYIRDHWDTVSRHNGLANIVISMLEKTNYTYKYVEGKQILTVTGKEKK